MLTVFQGSRYALNWIEEMICLRDSLEGKLNDFCKE